MSNSMSNAILIAHSGGLPLCPAMCSASHRHCLAPIFARRSVSNTFRSNFAHTEHRFYPRVVRVRAEAAITRASQKTRIGFVGGGNMAFAMIKGFIASELCDPADISVIVRSDGPKTEAIRVLGVNVIKGDATTAGSLSTLAEASDVIFLSVKPFIMGKVVEELANHVKTDKLVATVAAGIEISDYEAVLPPGTRFVRVMPNTPCAVQEGVCSYTRGTHATEDDARLMQSLLGTLGVACEVEERLIHAVIGVAGSAPAYLFLAIEALADGGVRAGLPRDVAQRMAAQTVVGAGRMVLESGEHPGMLKDKVCSPGGTTIEAVAALEREGLRRALLAAVEAAATKSMAMAGKK